MFPERLRTLRTEKRLTQNELANELGVSNKTISVYEKGTSSPTLETLERIADYFNVTTDFIIGYSKERNPKLEELSTELNISPNAIEAIKAITENGLDIISPLFENKNFIEFLTFSRVYVLLPAVETKKMTDSVFNGLSEELSNLPIEAKRNLMIKALKASALDCIDKALDEITVQIKPPVTE